MLAQLAGVYEEPSGSSFQVAFTRAGTLCLRLPGQPEFALRPYRALRFHVKEFSDLTFEFQMADGRVLALKQITPSGELVLKRKEIVR